MIKTIILFILTFTLIIASVVLTFFFLRKKKKLKKRLYASKNYQEQFEYHSYKITSAINQKKLVLESQSAQWQDEMKNISYHLEKSKVTKLILCNGTFAGDDPLHLFSLLEKIVPIAGELTSIISKKMFTTIKNNIVRDIGNFTPEYLNLLNSSLDEKIKVNQFSWSSANHHYARFQAALNLIENLCNSSDKRILILGHSHAGQIFALITQLLDPIENQKFSNIFQEKNFNLKKQIKFLKTKKLDFVTLGTPPRYKWINHKNINVLHFINHRGSTPIAGKLSGLSTTRDGDYIQQLALSGSDVLSPIKEEGLLNIKLDKILDKGVDLNLLRESISKKERLHKTGLNLLIDYKDSDQFPNFFRTNFGHGIYTRYHMMIFNLNLICEKLYR